MSGATCIITIGAQWILVVTDVIVWWLWNNIVMQVKICIVNCTPFKCCLMCPLWIFNLENGNICFILFLIETSCHPVFRDVQCSSKNLILVEIFFFFQLYELPGIISDASNLNISGKRKLLFSRKTGKQDKNVLVIMVYTLCGTI